MVWARPVAAEINLTPGGHPRSSGQAILPDGADGLQTERGGRSAAPELGKPWMSIPNAWELQLDVWIEVIFAVRSGRNKWGVIRSGLGRVNTKWEERAFEWGNQDRGAEVWPCFRVY